MIRVQSLLKKLQVDEDTLIDAAFEQPQLFAKIAQYRKECVLRRLKKVAMLELAETEAALAIRKKLVEEGERATEGAIREEVRSKRNIQDLRARVIAAEALDEYSKLIVDAFRMRKECIRVGADLLGDAAAIAGLPSGVESKLGRLRDQIEDKYPKAGRASD